MDSSRKFYKKGFLIRLLNNIGDFYQILIGWLIEFSVHTLQPILLSPEGVILCILILDVHQIIGHCIIPLYLLDTSEIYSPMSPPSRDGVQIFKS